jgi:hypothetical protein
VTNNITFQVDMAEQSYLGTFTAGDAVYVEGSFNGWSQTSPMTNNPALNVTNGQGIVSSLPYQATVSYVGSPGAAMDYKFTFVNGSGTQWDQPIYTGEGTGGNRGCLNATQTLPIVSWSDAPFVAITVTNNVTFEVDMSVQTAVGAFNSATGGYVLLAGDFNSWDNGTSDSTYLMTNSPSDPNTNHFYITQQFIGGQGELHYFKYIAEPGTVWESINNRTLGLVSPSGNYTDGPTYFDNEGPSYVNDVVKSTNCMVTFTVDMTPAVTAGKFTPGVDDADLNGLDNGDVNSYWTWGTLAGAPANYQMTEIGNGNIYTITVPILQGQPVDLTYKYGIDGQDIEAPSNDNHSRYIRSQPNYSMPTDTWAGQGDTTSTEPSMGDLTVGYSSGKVALSWLTRVGVQLQSATSLTPPIVWTPLPLTDASNLPVVQGPGNLVPVGTTSTNYTTGSGARYFELIGPQ